MQTALRAVYTRRVRLRISFLNVTESTWFLDFYINISFTLALAGPRLSGLGE